MKVRSVLHVSANRYPPLPAEHHTRAIWRELALVAEQYHVLARSEPGPASTTSEGNLTLHLLRSRMERQAEIFAAGARIHAVAEQVRPDVIITQCPVLGGIAAARSARGLGVPLFVEMHGEHLFRARGGPAWRNAHFHILARPVLRQAQAIRVLSEHMGESLRETYGDEIAEKAIVVPTRVNLATFAPRVPGDDVPGSLRIVTVGSFIPLKNHLALIDAIRDVPGVTMTIVGDGPLRPVYERHIRDTGLGDKVRLHPWANHRELARVLAEHDAYVHYSTTEALSRAILEAMAVALPVIASDVGFVRGVLSHGIDCVLLGTPWDETLRAAVVRLRDDPAWRRALGQAARTRIESDFDAARVFESYREAIRQTAERPVTVRGGA